MGAHSHNAGRHGGGLHCRGPGPGWPRRGAARAEGTYEAEAQAAEPKEKAVDYRSVLAGPGWRTAWTGMAGKWDALRDVRMRSLGGGHCDPDREGAGVAAGVPGEGQGVSVVGEQGARFVDGHEGVYRRGEVVLCLWELEGCAGVD